MKPKAYRAIPRLRGRGRDIDAIINQLEVGTGQIGDGRERFVRMSDFEDVDFAKLQKNTRGHFELQSIGTSEGVQTPTAPTNFTARAGFTHVVLSWDYPAYSGHSYTEIWRSADDNFGTAVRVGTEVGEIFGDILDYGAQVYYWARHVNVNDASGPLNATAGTYAETAQNISEVIQERSDELNETHLAQHLRSRIDLIDADSTGLVAKADELNARADSLQSQISSLTVSTDVRIFFQPDEPPGTYADGSRWYNTGSGNYPYVWSDGGWRDAKDQEVASIQVSLESEIVNRQSADDTQLARLDSLDATVIDLDAGVASNAGASSLLDTRVTTVEGTTSTHSSSITALQTETFNLNLSIGSNVSALSALDARVINTESGIASVASDVTQLQAEVDSLDVGGNAAAISGLDARVSANEAGVSSASSDLASLTADIDAFDLMGTAQTVALIESRVTANENSIISSSSSTTSLENSVSALSGGQSANASAISSLTTQVTNLDGEVGSQSTLVAQLGSGDFSNFATFEEMATVINGLEARWSVKTQVGDLFGGIGLANDGETTRFYVNADQFALLNDDNDGVSPFFIQDGNTYINSVLIPAASIQVAQIEQLTTDDISGYTSEFVLSTIGVGSITNAYIANVIQSSNYAPGLAGWKIDKIGSIEAHSFVLYDGNGNIVFSSGTGLEWTYVSGDGRPENGADVTGDHPNETLSDELILDRDFEADGEEYWSADATKQESGSKFGSKCLALGALDFTEVTCFQKIRRSSSDRFLVAVEPSETLYFSCWRRVTGGTSAGIGLIFFAEDGAELVESFWPEYEVGAVWKFSSFTVNAPPGAYFVNVEMGALSASSGVAYFDRLSLRKSAPGSTRGATWGVDIDGDNLPSDNADRTIDNPQSANWLTDQVVGNHNRITPENISTYMAGAAIGYAQIGSAEVGTLTLAGQSVTATQVAESSNIINWNQSDTAYWGSLSRSISMAHAVSTSSVLIQAMFILRVEPEIFNNGFVKGTLKLRIMQGVRVVFNEHVGSLYASASDTAASTTNGEDTALMSILVPDSPGAGVFTYTVDIASDIDGDSGDFGVHLSYRSIALHGAKR